MYYNYTNVETIVEAVPFISYIREKGCYAVNFDGEVYEQRLCEFVHTYNFLLKNKPETFLMNISSEFDTVTLPLSSHGDTLVLSIIGFLRFRELYMQEMYHLKLDDLLYRSRIARCEAELV